MTATAQYRGDYAILGDAHDTIPSMFARQVAANAQLGHAQFATISPSTGFVSLNDGTVPGQISGGVLAESEIAPVTAVATGGLATVRLSQQWFVRRAASTLSNDGFSESDVGVPFWIANENTPGKLSHTSSANRSLGGLVFGFDKGSGTPNLWCGMVPWLIARATILANSFGLPAFRVTDANAAATLSETLLTSPQKHGVVTGIRYVGAAVTASDSTYATFTVAKRDGAGGAAVTLGTLVTKTTSGSGCGDITAFIPMAFTLTATAADLQILETDIITITEAKASTGVQVVGQIELTIKVG